jgi:recombination protein RecR
MDTIEELTRLFERFPGIGARQAKRFVLFLLKASPQYRAELSATIGALSGSATQCPLCTRFHGGTRGATCRICLDTGRVRTQLLVVLYDQDIDAFEKTEYRGLYFVLGGLVELGSDELKYTRTDRLLARIQQDEVLSEIVFALPATTEGDLTTRRVSDLLHDAAGTRALTLSLLARGLSTGSEIEYADPETLRAAFTQRRVGTLTKL